MLGFLPPILRLIITLSLGIINTIIHGSVTALPLPFKWLAPNSALTDRVTRFCLRSTENWCAINDWLIRRLLPPIDWQVDLPPLDASRNYFLVCNHQSWVDIILLFSLFNRKIPLIRFFTKREIAWIPFVGFALVGLDFPLMQRYSKEKLAKHPHLRGKDVETTRRSCRQIARNPFSVLNFLEGTRFTPVKHDRQQSPYRYLLKPKATGMAFALSSLGDTVTEMVDVTLYYPDGIPTFLDLWSGRIRKVVLTARVMPIPAGYTAGDYENDPAFRAEFQGWVQNLWEEKDSLLAELHRQHAPAPEAALSRGRSPFSELTRFFTP